MTSDVQGQVLGVTGRSVSGGKTIYDIAFSNGVKYTTFNQEVASKAQQFAGQQVTATVTVKPSADGRFTNYYFEDVVPMGSVPPQVTQTITATPPIPMAETISDAERQKLIVRQNVLGTSFGFAASIFTGAGPESWDEAEEKAMALAGKLYARVFATPQATPQTVAAEINTAVGGEAVVVGAGVSAPQEDDIPW